MSNEKRSAYSRLKIFAHPQKVQDLLEDRVSAPVHIRIKPTNNCNHKCFYCIYDPSVGNMHIAINRNDEIPREKMMEILDNLNIMGVKAITWTGGGEPLIYPHIEEALEKTIRYGIDFAILTNGQALEGRKAELLADAKFVRVSVDSVNSEQFERIRRKSGKLFHRLIKNIGDFARTRKPECEYGVSFLINKENSNSVYEAARLFKQLGLERIRFAPIWTKEGSAYHDSIRQDVNEQIARARQDFEDKNFEVYDTYGSFFDIQGRSQRTYSKCYRMQINPVIAADCGVYFCQNKAYDPSGLLGFIKDRSFKELWFSKEAAEKFKTFNPKEVCKHQCTHDQKNIDMHEVKNSMGDNFA